MAGKIGAERDILPGFHRKKSEFEFKLLYYNQKRRALSSSFFSVPRTRQHLFPSGCPLPYYKEARIFLMTSAYEGFPMTLLEAQQQGVVCVAMDTYESLHYILNDGENGDIVPDTGMLEKKVKQLMNDPALLKRYADKGLQTCRRFDVEAVVDKWETLYKGLI